MKAKVTKKTPTITTTTLTAEDMRQVATMTGTCLDGFLHLKANEHTPDRILEEWAKLRPTFVSDGMSAPGYENASKEQLEKRKQHLVAEFIALEDDATSLGKLAPFWGKPVVVIAAE